MRDRDSGSHLFSFLLGGIIGIVIGLLYAPRPGEQTRQKLKGAMDDLKDKYDDLKDKIEEGKEKIEDVVEKAKKVYTKGRGRKKSQNTETEEDS